MCICCWGHDLVRVIWSFYPISARFTSYVVIADRNINIRMAYILYIVVADMVNNFYCVVKYYHYRLEIIFPLTSIYHASLCAIGVDQSVDKLRRETGFDLFLDIATENHQAWWNCNWLQTLLWIMDDQDMGPLLLTWMQFNPNMDKK